MKKHFIYKYGLLLSVLIAIGCGSCQKDNYVQYDAGYASLRFIYTAEGNDSIVYSFALHPDKQEDIVEIPFKLVGLAVGQAREIGVEVVKEETTAQENDHFIIERSELPADSIKGILKVNTTGVDIRNKTYIQINKQDDTYYDEKSGFICIGDRKFYDFDDCIEFLSGAIIVLRDGKVVSFWLHVGSNLPLF